MHSWITNKRANDPAFKKASQGDSHEYMANNLRGDLIKGMKEYAKQNNITDLSEQDYDDLSWGGLEDTKAFNKKFDTQEKKDAWIKRTDNLLYKPEKKEE